MVTSPAVSWLFFKARAKRPYLTHTGRASNAEKQLTGPGPEGCVENGPAAALLVGYVSIQICALRAKPARTALPTAHFERNDVTIICETVHQVHPISTGKTQRIEEGIKRDTLLTTQASGGLGKCQCHPASNFGVTQGRLSSEDPSSPD
jgi:hypothetical protein